MQVHPEQRHEGDHVSDVQTGSCGVYSAIHAQSLVNQKLIHNFSFSGQPMNEAAGLQDAEHALATAFSDLLCKSCPLLATVLLSREIFLCYPPCGLYLTFPTNEWGCGWPLEGGLQYLGRPIHCEYFLREFDGCVIAKRRISIIMFSPPLWFQAWSSRLDGAIGLKN